MSVNTDHENFSSDVSIVVDDNDENSSANVYRDGSPETR